MFEEIVSGGGYDGSSCYKPLARPIVCEDGTTLSVQASKGHYCCPRNDFGPYDAVEVGYPDNPPGSWSHYRGSSLEVYGYVPVELVREYIESHGGERKSI